MKISIHIEEATPGQLATVALALSKFQNPVLKVTPPAEKPQKPTESTKKPKQEKKRRGWSKKAIRLANTKTPEAPYGLKMDGTPRKPTGLQKKEKK